MQKSVKEENSFGLLFFTASLAAMLLHHIKEKTMEDIINNDATLQHVKKVAYEVRFWVTSELAQQSKPALESLGCT